MSNSKETSARLCTNYNEKRKHSMWLRTIKTECENEVIKRAVKNIK